MCGLVGFISQTNKKNILVNMLKVQTYRGPDDTGYFYDCKSGVHLGHNRLAIQDLSDHGRQPFKSKCEKYIIAFNGEVYNFKLLKKELIKYGYIFTSKSDTEVILYAYIEWGIDCVHKFIGMFAFSILDKISGQLFLVRDRAGVKPLYYYQNKVDFLFSSEIKSFHEYPEFVKKLNHKVLPFYFQFGYIPAPYSIFENCFKLKAGHYLQFNLQSKGYDVVKYWDVDEFYKMPKFNKNESRVLNDIEDILNDAVELRTVSDVPIGVFLSGGYDSSLIASMLAKNKHKKIKTFTIGFNDSRYNEAEHARDIAIFLGTDHTELYVNDKDMLDLVEDLPFYYDEPFGDSSALPTMMVSKLAKETVVVVLSGDGGDETFFGYSKYFFLYKFKNIFLVSYKRWLLKSFINLIHENVVEVLNNILPKNIRQTNVKDKFGKFKRSINSKTLTKMFQNSSSRVNKKDINKILKILPDEVITNDLFKNKNELTLPNYMMSVDYKTFMSDDVLVKVDRATMSHSLEGREPLLDHRIIEYLARTPINLKYKNNQGKYLLRQVLYRYLPRKLVDKPKSGFQIPLKKWLKGDLKYLVDKYLDENKLDSEIFNIQEVVNLRARLSSGDDVNVNQIWHIIMFEMWKEKWLD
jgi:asparagine synthase (glutamine-hydrolysing)